MHGGDPQPTPQRPTTPEGGHGKGEELHLELRWWNVIKHGGAAVCVFIEMPGGYSSLLGHFTKLCSEGGAPTTTTIAIAAIGTQGNADPHRNICERTPIAL